MKKIMLFLIALIPLVLIFTIQLTTEYIENTHYIAVEKVTFTENYQVIKKTTDENVVLNFPARIAPISATNKEIIYTSSNENIATVNASGLITFYDFGNVTITAKSKATESIFDSCTFFITDDKAHRLNITNKQSTLLLNNYFYLSAIITPAEALDKSLTYSSSNPQAITVMPDGKVTAVGDGESVITVSTANGKTDSFTIKTIIPVTGIEIDNANANLITGSKFAKFPNVKVLPTNATNQNVIYSSKNNEVATIDGSGNIVFNSAGEVVFAATTVDGEYGVEYTVRYTGGYFISMQVSNSSKSINVEYEQDKQIDINLDVFPLDADYSNIRYVSSDESVVKVEDNKLLIAGGGNAVITVYAHTGTLEISSQANIFVKRDAEQIVTDNISTVTNVCNIVYNVLPIDHTNTVSFSLSSNLATITGNQITFSAPGNVKVTIQTDNNVSKEILVTYSPKDTDIKAVTTNNQVIADINYQDEFNISFDISMNMGKPVYSGYDSNILSFNEATQTFTALDGGSTTITATDGVNTYNISVTIYRKVSQINYSLSNPDTNEGLNIENGKVVTGLKKVKLLSSTYPATATIAMPTITLEDYTETKVNLQDDKRYNNKLLSSVSEIATINNDYELVFNKAGSVKVTLAADDVVQSFIVQSTYGSIHKVIISAESKNLDIDYNEEDDYYLDIDYTFEPKDGDVTNLTYSVVSGTSVVIDNGKVKVISGGNSVIRLTGDVLGSFDTFTVNVKQNADSIDIKDNDNVLNITESHYQIKYSVLPITHTNKIKFSSDSTIAIVSSTGYVSFNAPGKVIVTVYSEESEVYDTIEIWYTAANVTKTISASVSDVQVNYLENFGFVFDLDNPMGLPEYSGYDNSVITYDSATQTFTAVQGGTTTILVTDGSTNITINLQVVKKAIDINFNLYDFDDQSESLTFKESGENYSITTALSKFKLKAKTLDEYATIKTPTITISDAYSNIATIDSNGVIEFVKAGTIQLVMKADAITKTIAITSTYGYMLEVTATTKLYNYNYNTMDDKNIVVQYKYSPIDAKIEYISFESSNQSTVKVEGNNLVVVGGGKAVITIKAKINDTEFVTDTCVVNVIQSATSIIINNVVDGVINTQNNVYQVNASSLPTTNTDTLTYSVNTNIASVDDSGELTFYAPGKVVLTVSANASVKEQVVVRYIPSNFNEKELSDTNLVVNVNYNDTFGLIFDESMGFGLPTYSEYDSSILTFNNVTNKFTAIKGGTTTIAVTDGLTQKTIQVNVYKKVDSITSKIVYVDTNQELNTDSGMYITAYSTAKVLAVINPDHATVQTVGYQILSGGDIATINSTGVITFTKAGVVEVKVFAEDVYNILKIKSTYLKPENFEIYNVTINADITKPSLILDDLGVTYTLVLSGFAPSDYTDIYKVSHAEFISLNNQVVTVNSDGVIKAVGKGTTTITVEFKISDTTSITKSFIVEVQVKATGVQILNNGNEVLEGKILNSSITLNYSLLPGSPNSPNNQNVRIELISQNVNHETVASITNIDTANKQFTLTFNNGVNDGEAYIRISTEDSNYSILKEVKITKTSILDAFKIKQGETDITGTTIYNDYTTSYQLVTLEASSQGLLDAPDVSKFVAVSSNSNNIAVQAELQNGNATGVFRITKLSNLNKSVAETITFGYGSTAIGTTVSATFKFYDISLKLNIIDENHLLGLQRKHVFGTSRYYTTDGTNYVLENNLPVEYTKIMVGGANAVNNTDTLYWMTSDSNIATISTSNGSVYLNFNPNNVTSEVQLTVYVSLEPITANCANFDTIHDSVKSKFTYNIVNGYNIYDSAGYAYCVSNNLISVMQKDISVNFTNTLNKTHTISTYSKTEGILWNKRTVYYYTLVFKDISKMIYGNGNVLSYENWVNISVTDGTNTHKRDSGKLEMKFNGGLTNVIIKCSPNDVSKTNYEAIICLNNVTVSYTRFQNFGKIWTGSANSTTYFKNCIFENSKVCGIQMGTDGGDTYKVYLENTLFYENGQLAIEQQAGKLYISGIFEIFNFASASEFNVGTLGAAAATAIQNAYNNYSSDVVYTDSSTNTKYANVGIGILGTNVKTNDKLYLDDGSGNYVMYNFSKENTSDINLNEEYKLSMINETYLVYNIYLLVRPTQYATLNVLPEEVINLIYAPIS